MQAAQEFGMVVSQTNVRDNFEADFMKWALAVVKYAKETQVHSSAIQHILQDCSEDSDASKLLGECMILRGEHKQVHACVYDEMRV